MMSAKTLSPYNVNPGEGRGEVTAPSSKSYANRLLILAARSPQDIFLRNIPPSSDVTAMTGILRQLGVIIEEQGDGLLIKGSFPACEKEAPGEIIIASGDGGTTNRFILPLLALGKNTYLLTPSGPMMNRPMDEAITYLSSLGAQVELQDQGQIKIQGPLVLPDNIIEVDCSRSTQFISGLALSLNRYDLLSPLHLKSSLKYWQLTKEIIKNFSNKEEINIMIDFSSLSYILALAALSGPIHIKNCFGADEFQADSIFLQILKECGASLRFSEAGLIVQKSAKGLTPFRVDANDCPDLIPTLIFLASYIDGMSEMINLEVLRHKECDRLAEMLRMLDLFGIPYELVNEGEKLIISGATEHICSQRVDYIPPQDHRMVMTAYLFMRKNKGGTIYDSHHVEKSFANFFQVMESLR